MRIIIVYDFAFVNGGAAKVAITEAAELANRGYDVTFFSGVGPIDDRLVKSGAKIVCLDQNELKNQLGDFHSKIHGALQGFWNFTAKERFSSLLDDFRPDDTVIHFHGWSLALSPALFSVTASKQFKIAITCHDYEINCPVRTYFDYNKMRICDCRAMSVGCLFNNCDKRSYFQKVYRILRQKMLQRLLKKNKVSLIFLSEFNKKIIEKDLSFTCNEYTVPNLVDIPPQIDIHPEQNSSYLFIGRFNLEKGVRMFCEAIKRAGVHGIAIGDGDEIDKLKCDYPEVTFTGWLRPEEMIGYILKSRCLVMSSLWYEGAPLIIPEVQCAYALPCIVPTPCGAQEYILDRRTGWIYSSGCIEELVTCIEESKNDSVIKAMHANCIELDYKKEYTPAIHVERILKVYNSIINSC